VKIDRSDLFKVWLKHFCFSRCLTLYLDLVKELLFYCKNEPVLAEAAKLKLQTRFRADPDLPVSYGPVEPSGMPWTSSSCC
jgi:hypothetical protein